MLPLLNVPPVGKGEYSHKSLGYLDIPEYQEYRGGSALSPLHQYLVNASHSDKDETAVALLAHKDFIAEHIKTDEPIKANSTNENVNDAIHAINSLVSPESTEEPTKGGYTEPNPADSISVAKSTYDLLKDYAKEVGTSKHVEKYLEDTFKIKSLKVKDGSKKDIKYPKLYNLIEQIINQNNIKSPEDFIKFTKMSYVWFVPENKKQLILGAYKYDVDSEEVKDLFDEYLSGSQGSQKFDNYDAFVSSHKFFKLKPTFAKKSVAVIKKAKGRAFAFDVIPMLPDIKEIVKDLKDKQPNIFEKAQSKLMADDYEKHLLRRALRNLIYNDYPVYIEPVVDRFARRRLFEGSNRAEIERQRQELVRQQRLAREAQIAADEIVARELQARLDREDREARDRAAAAPPLMPAPGFGALGRPGYVGLPPEASSAEESVD